MALIEGTKEAVETAIRNQVCAEHGEHVGAVWDGKASIYRVRCARGEYLGLLKPGETAAQVIKRGPAENVPMAFSSLPTKDLGDDHTLTPQMQQALITYARNYGLDPYRNHVAVMYNQPYITIDGYYYHARRTRQPVKIGSRPLTTAERKSYQIGEHDLAWVAEGEIVGGNTYMTGLGIVTADEMTAHSKKVPGRLRSPIVAAHPQLMAQKRAEWQLLRRLFPLGADDRGGSAADDVVTPYNSTRVDVISSGRTLCADETIVTVSADDKRRLDALDEIQHNVQE